MKAIKTFKIRASACGNIMSGTVGLTDLKQNKLHQLMERFNDPDGKPLTDKMTEEMNSLAYLDNHPVLPDGAKTYCELWLKEQIYARRKFIQTKYMDKGISVEDHSLDFVARHLGLGMVLKNEEQFEDEFMTGEPDAILDSLIIDVKNSWDCFTFPLFEDDIPSDIYFWQAQVYMHLVGRDKFKLIYTLLDTPDNLIEREARSYVFKNGLGELDEVIMADFTDRMTYPNIDDDLKIKIFDIDFDPSKIQEIKQRVEMCRTYINELVEGLI